ncbi:hypothetical protein ABIA27_001205 [Sinorhizobium fredii]
MTDTEQPKGSAKRPSCPFAVNFLSPPKNDFPATVHERPLCAPKSDTEQGTVVSQKRTCIDAAELQVCAFKSDTEQSTVVSQKRT